MSRRRDVGSGMVRGEYPAVPAGGSRMLRRRAHQRVLRGRDLRIQERRSQDNQLQAGPHLATAIPRLRSQVARLEQMSTQDRERIFVRDLAKVFSFLPDCLQLLLFVQALQSRIKRGNWHLSELTKMRFHPGCDCLPSVFALLESYDMQWLRSRLNSHEFFAQAMPGRGASVKKRLTA